MRGLRRLLLWFVLAVAGVLGVLYLYTQIQIRRASAEFQPPGRFIVVKGIRLHYTTGGNGPPVVLIHGNPGSTRDFSRVMADLVQDLQVVAVDRPGHGYSERRPAEDSTPLGQAHLLHATLQQLGVVRPVLAGHSWGGALALIYAIEYPQDVAGLVLIGTRAFAMSRPADPIFRLMRTPVLGTIFERTLILPVGRRMVAERLAAAYAPDPLPPQDLAMAQALWLRPEQARATVWDTQNLQEALPAYSPRYGTIATRVRIVVGDQDELRPESVRLHEAIPGSDLAVLPGVGHMVPRTRPAIVAEAVRRGR